MESNGHTNGHAVVASEQSTRIERRDMPMSEAERQRIVDEQMRISLKQAQLEAAGNFVQLFRN